MSTAGGPSANIGGSYEETQKVESTRSEEESVPTIPSAAYNKDYTGNTTKTVEIECGGTAKVSRAVQFVDDLPKTSTGKVMRRELNTLD